MHLNLISSKAVPYQGIITARILPSYLAPDIELSQPFRNDRVGDPNRSDNYNGVGQVVTLDVELFQPNVKFQMRRDGSESCSKLFKRLSVSLAKALSKPTKVSSKKLRNAKHSCQQSCPEIIENNKGAKVSVQKVGVDTVRGRVNISLDDLSAASLFQGVDGSNLFQRELLPPAVDFVNNRISIPWTSIDPKSINIHLTHPMIVDFDVLCNPPTILTNNLSNDYLNLNIYVGNPIPIPVSSIQVEPAYNVRDHEFSANTVYSDGIECIWFADCREVDRGINKCYIPTEKDIGKIMSVQLIPSRGGLLFKEEDDDTKNNFKFHQPVRPVPTIPIVDKLRRNWLHKHDNKCDDHLRVLSYNLLSDMYVSIDKSAQFSYCDPKFLHKNHRLPTLVSEMIAYGADIMCFQEVDESSFVHYIYPCLRFLGYDGFHTNKLSEQKEGCSIFWRRDKFDIELKRSIPFRDLFSKKDFFYDDNEWSCMPSVHKLIESHDELRSILQDKLGTIMQVISIKTKSSHKSFLLVNTHLFFHPMASHVRALQALVMCKFIGSIRRRSDEFTSCEDKEKYPILICGDLNARTKSAAAQLLFTKIVEPGDDSNCWRNLDTYTYENDKSLAGTSSISSSNDDTDDEQRLLPSLVLPKSFPKLYSGCQPMPEFTNFVPSFTETLDYILLSCDFPCDVRKDATSAPMPSTEFIKKFGKWMPNEFMSSDHVSVLCNIVMESNANIKKVDKSDENTPMSRVYPQQ